MTHMHDPPDLDDYDFEHLPVLRCDGRCSGDRPHRHGRCLACGRQR